MIISTCCRCIFTAQKKKLFDRLGVDPGVQMGSAFVMMQHAISTLRTLAKGLVLGQPPAFITFQ